jgi:hypothetical protein
LRYIITNISSTSKSGLLIYIIYLKSKFNDARSKIKKFKIERKIYLIRINQDEKNWLISKGYIKNIKGRFVGLVVCNKEHMSRSKTYFVEDSYAYYLRNRQK